MSRVNFLSRIKFYPNKIALFKLSRNLSQLFINELFLSFNLRTTKTNSCSALAHNSLFELICSNFNSIVSKTHWTSALSGCLMLCAFYQSLVLIRQFEFNKFNSSLDWFVKVYVKSRYKSKSNQFALSAHLYDLCKSIYLSVSLSSRNQRINSNY